MHISQYTASAAILLMAVAGTTACGKKPAPPMTDAVIEPATTVEKGQDMAGISNLPSLEHIAVWAEDISKTAAFLNEALGWKSNPLEFGVADDNPTFGGMQLSFVDANGMWLELVQPTTAGPGMEFLKEKGNGGLVELDFMVADFDRNVADLKARGIDVIGMDGKPMTGGGLLKEWVLIDGKRVDADERLSYLPFDLARGTSIELAWEYPNGAMFVRDSMIAPDNTTPASAPRLDHIVVLSADLEATAKVYTDILRLPRHPLNAGIHRDWMGLGADAHVWIEANKKGFWIEIVAPPPGTTPELLKKNADGTLIELGVEVADIEAFHGQMAAKGITLTAGDATPLPAGSKAVTDAASGDRYAYFPLDRSQGMRILVFQRGPAATSVFSRRDQAWQKK